MSQARPLDVVIRKVEKGTKNESDAAKLVFIDCQKKKAVPRPSLFKPAYYYLVSNTDDALNFAKCRGPICAVADFETGDEIGVCVNYEARVEPSHEERAAEALCGDAHPGLVLDGLLKKWVAAFTNEKDPGHFIGHYYEQRQELQKYIVNKAEHEAGLTLKVTLSLDGEDSLGTVNVGPTRASVRLRDSDREEDLKLSAELLVDESDKVHAVLSMNAEDRLEYRVVSALRRYLVEEVTLHQFYTELNGHEFKATLKRHLDRELRGSGRRVGQLRLESKAEVPEEHRFFELKHPVTCDIPEFPKPVEIKNKLQMKLVDVARYQSIQPAEPADRIRKSLERVIHEQVFGKKYIDLLLNFREPENGEDGGGLVTHAAHNGSGSELKIATRIKAKMRAEAAAIGYDLQQLISQPDLEPYKLLDNFTIEPEQTFATRVSDVHVKLRLVITARINDLTDVQDYLNRQEKVQEAMEKVAVEEAGQYLHEIDPSDFYMNFSFSKDGNGPTVEEALVGRIRKRLEKKFKAHVVSVVPVPLDDKLIERLKALRRELCPFDVTVEPLYSGERFVFKGKFQVVGVDSEGWYTFQSRDEGIEKVSETFSESVEAYLVKCSDEMLRDPPGGYDTLRLAVQKEVNARLKEGYGLVMSITTFSRKRTKSEEDVAKVEQAYASANLKGIGASIESLVMIQDSLTEQLKSLLARRIGIVTSEESADELEELDEKIRGIQEQQAATSKRLVKQQVLRARAETLPETMRNNRRLGTAVRDVRKALGAAEPESHNGGAGEEK
ncbi:MAG: hypothetical protein ABW208_03800 [Pyrinomonadaceae bacterium]